MNPALKQPQSELSAASRSIDAMKTATTFEEFESEWREFLTCIEKAWNKTERVCQSQRDRFQPWQGKYQSLRKKDMLLRYLKQARDADNHSIQDIAELKPGYTGLNFADPRGGYIKNLEIQNGQIVRYEGDPAVLTIRPPHPVALPVKNSGQWYNPPTSHLGLPVADANPVSLAILGLKFYEDFLMSVEQEFFHK